MNSTSNRESVFQTNRSSVIKNSLEKIKNNCTDLHQQCMVLGNHFERGMTHVMNDHQTLKKVVGNDSKQRVIRGPGSPTHG